MTDLGPFFVEAESKTKTGPFKLWAGRMLRAAQDLLWPPVCSVCPRALPLAPDPSSPSAYFCPECLESVEMMAAAICPVCGRPFFNSQGHVCGDCLADPPPYGRARAAAVYRGGLSRSIARLKYGGELHQLRALEALAGAALIAALPPGSGSDRSQAVYDLIVPMPISKRRLAERGFNQSAELARAIYRPWAALIDEDALLRISDGQAHQATLDARRRRKAIRGCFLVPDPNRVKNARILLFDDVLTTGATAGEAVTTLLKAGAGQVDLATIARTVLESWR